MALKRSQINTSIRISKEHFRELGLHLPPLAYWTVDDWDSKGSECDEIRDCMLGWDVTDFGSGRFEQIGRILFTLRNGAAKNARYRKAYAEKFILDPEGQRAPAHFHRGKMEDIVNRGGGNICVQLTASDAEGQRSTESFHAQVNGEEYKCGPGETIVLKPGHSVCIEPRTIHQFWGQKGSGWTVSGEVSTVCDDWNDNCFLEPATRFPEIIEDEPREAFLCHEYPRAH